jgi:hypothetical protein
VLRAAAHADEAPAVPRRLVKLPDAPRVWLVASEGTALLPIDDEATFLQNGFAWSEVETITPAEFGRYRPLAFDAGTARACGLRLAHASAESRATPVHVLEETPLRARLLVEREEPGWLVITAAHDPGWKARVDGVPAVLQRANGAFSALALERGRSEIELEYAPDSFVLGARISAACALVGIVLAFLCGRPGARAARARA